MPAFQFYPADWRKDPGVQSLSWSDKGVWFEILCLMHESPRRGVLLMPSGAPMMSVSLARIMGLPLKQTIECLERFMASGVASREDESGALYNRRMVRDEITLQKRRVGGEAGGVYGNLPPKEGSAPRGRPPKEKYTDEGVNRGVYLKPLENPPSPSSSSSSSSSEEPPIVPAPPALDKGFEDFWKSYPRKIGKGAALKIWRRINPKNGMREIISNAVLAQKQSEQWLKDNGQYIPNPATWLNQSRWDDEVLTRTVPDLSFEERDKEGQAHWDKIKANR